MWWNMGPLSPAVQHWAFWLQRQCFLQGRLWQKVQILKKLWAKHSSPDFATRDKGIERALGNNIICVWIKYTKNIHSGPFTELTPGTNRQIICESFIRICRNQSYYSLYYYFICFKLYYLCYFQFPVLFCFNLFSKRLAFNLVLVWLKYV